MKKILGMLFLYLITCNVGFAETFTTSDFGLGFFCGQRGEGEA